jgi:hypothetical protein
LLRGCASGSCTALWQSLRWNVLPFRHPSQLLASSIDQQSIVPSLRRDRQASTLESPERRITGKIGAMAVVTKKSSRWDGFPRGSNQEMWVLSCMNIVIASPSPSRIGVQVLSHGLILNQGPSISPAFLLHVDQGRPIA